MLGRDLCAVLSDQDVTAADRLTLDITDTAAVLDRVDGHDVVVNCAAWTAVDQAESDEAAAFGVNAVGAANLARACTSTGTHLVQVSTDYVFDGRPLVEAAYDEDDAIAPRTAYGRTKAAGEWAVRTYLPDAHWIVRTAWLYGAHGPSFVRTMAQLEGSRPTVDVVDDQFGQPTWTHDVATAIRALVLARPKPGTYHATSTGHTSWHGLATEVFTLLGADPARVLHTTSEQFARPAPRPRWSVLGHTTWLAAGLPELPHWADSLRRALVDDDILERDTGSSVVR
jgi:dTDP-4-dehydrorhamnose reductase